MGVFVKVAEQGELADREAKLVEIEGRQIALIRSGDKYYALDNACTHRGGPLAEGSVVGNEVECPWHGAPFDLETGEVRQPPRREVLRLTQCAYKAATSRSNCRP